MARKNLRLTFRRVENKSRLRQTLAESVIFPDGLSPLAKYVEENMDSGLPVSELIWQFQEYDCEHVEVSVLAAGQHAAYDCCQNCGRITKRSLRR
jgi:hypothetical protein